MRSERCTLQSRTLQLFRFEPCTAIGNTARRPGFPQPWYWHGTVAGVSQIQFDRISVAPNPFPFLLYLFYGTEASCQVWRGVVEKQSWV